MKQYISEQLVRNFLASLAVAIIAAVLVRFITKLYSAIIKKSETVSTIAGIKTYIILIFQIVKVMIIAFAVLVILQIFGVDVSSVIAGLGITSAVLAFAVQDMLKDFIQGFRILLDGFFKVGDFIKYNGEDYQVTFMSMRTTVLKNVKNGDTVYVSNRNISEATKLSGFEILPVLFPYEADSDKINEIINKSLEQIGQIKGVTKPKCAGIREFGDSGVFYSITFTCKPTTKYVNRALAYRIIKDNMEKEGIYIPYNKVEILSTST